MSPKQSTALYKKVCQILWEQWDPIGVNCERYASGENDWDWPNDEYDSYAGTLCRFLIEGRDEQTLIAHLEQIQRNAMGLSSIDSENDQRVARLLLSLINKEKS